MEKRIIIIGAGIAGQILARDINRYHRGCEVVGFIDDTRRNGQRYLGTIDETAAVLDRYRVDEMVMAIPSADGALVRRLLAVNMNNRVPIKIVPREQWVLSKDKVKYNQVRNLVFDDWLGRPLVKKGIRKLEAYYRGKTVLVTGGAGSIGAEMVRQLLGLGVKKVAVLDNSEWLMSRLEQELAAEAARKSRCQLIIGSVVDKNKTTAVVHSVKPELIFHAAAYKHVHLMEENIDEAFKTNTIGSVNVAQAARQAGVKKFVLVSTDKAVNPISVMGASKRLAEQYSQVQGGRTKFMIVRFGNVINSHGSALPLFAEQIKSGQAVTITDKRMKRYFMSIREASQLVIQSATRSTAGATYVLNMGDLINVYEVVRCLIRSHNLIPERDVVIKVVGRRPGEKITEELFSARERKLVTRTSMENIWLVKRPAANQDHIGRTLDELQKLLTEGDTVKLRKFVKTVFSSIKG